MQLYVNGQKMDLQVENLAELLTALAVDLRAVACAIDGQFVPRDQYSATVLSVGQKIEILSPMQGG